MYVCGESKRLTNVGAAGLEIVFGRSFVTRGQLGRISCPLADTGDLMVPAVQRH